MLGRSAGNNAVAYQSIMAIVVGLGISSKIDRFRILSRSGKYVTNRFAEWGTLIAGIAANTKELSWVDRHKKAEAQRFYNQLVLELRAFHKRGIETISCIDARLRIVSDANVRFDRARQALVSQSYLRKWGRRNH